MTKYKCLRCGYETDKKNNMIRHINRQKLCPPKISNIIPKNKVAHNRCCTRQPLYKTLDKRPQFLG